MTRFFGIVASVLALLTIAVSAAPAPAQSESQLFARPVCKAARLNVVGSMLLAEANVVTIASGPEITPENAVLVKNAEAGLTSARQAVVKLVAMRAAGMTNAVAETRDEVVKGLTSAQDNMNKVDPNFKEIKTQVEDAKRSLGQALDSVKTVTDNKC